ncbi:hypothetical protein [Nonomuraea sp. NPDC049624]|uniref:hypothetical protein n=1 Tax=unclassified Nonomuraea TaxID=2593643 RepID=UPI00342AF79F
MTQTRAPGRDGALARVRQADQEAADALAKAATARAEVAEPADNLVAYAMLPAGPRSIAIGCAGGKQRTVDRTTERHAVKERVFRRT